MSGWMGAVPASPLRPVMYLAACLAFAASPAAAGKAYVIIDAMRFPTSKHQPVSIALAAGARLVHVKAGSFVVPVKPGRYRIDHVDFAKRIMPSGNTVHLDHLRPVNVHVTAGSITYVGMIEIRSLGTTGVSGVTLDVSQPGILLQWACEANSGVFGLLATRVPLRDGSYKEIKVRCET